MLQSIDTAYGCQPEVEVVFLLLMTPPCIEDTGFRGLWAGTDMNAFSLRTSFMVPESIVQVSKGDKQQLYPLSAHEAHQIPA